MPKVKIKRNDQVCVIAGKDRGAIGRVLRVLPAVGKAIVEGANLIKRHTRPNPTRKVQGGIVEREAPIHLSNLMLLDPDKKKPTRVGRRSTSEGTNERYAKKSGASIA